MTLQKKKKYGRYFPAFIRFAKMIRRDYQPGDRIPPAGEMSKILKISRNTYTKVLAQALENQYLESRGNRGIFVLPRILKIGLYLGEFDIIQMIFPEMLQAIIAALNEAGIMLQLFRKLEPDSILQTNLFAIVIVRNDSGYRADTLKKEISVLKKTGIPQIEVDHSDVRNAGSEYPGRYVIYLNRTATNRTVLEFAVRHGYRKPGLIWSDFSLRESEATAAGLEHLFVVNPKVCARYPERCARHFARKKPDVLFIEFSAGIMQKFLTILQNHVTGYWNPDVYVYRSSGSPLKLREAYPNLNIKGVWFFDCRISADVLAAMILKHHQTGVPLQTIGVDSFTVQPI